MSSWDLEVKELAWNLLRDKPHLAMEYLDMDEDQINILYDDVNLEMNGSASEQYQIKW